MRTQTRTEPETVGYQYHLFFDVGAEDEPQLAEPVDTSDEAGFAACDVEDEYSTAFISVEAGVLVDTDEYEGDNVVALTYIVDHEGEGMFYAHVETEKGVTLFELSNENPESGWADDELELVTSGVMRHRKDTAGLLKYLRSQELVTEAATLHLTLN